jgi:hypothetical protein
MKLQYLIPAFLGVSLTIFNVRAHDEGEFHDHSEDCHIQGTETMDATIVLTATTNAPEGAGGIAKLESENEDGDATATLEIKTFGLLPGDYVLSAIRQSDSSSVILGQITVSSSGGDGEDEDENEDGDNNDDVHHSELSVNGSVQINAGISSEDHSNCDNGDSGETQSESEVQLPSDLNPADIAQIVLSDLDGNAFLTGDLTTPTNDSTISFTACVHVTLADGSTNSTGVAQIKSTVHKGKWKHHFTMVASGVASSSSFDVQVNGDAASSTKSNKKGRALVKKLPSNLLNVRSVSLIDAEGHTAASAKF